MSSSSFGKFAKNDFASIKLNKKRVRYLRGLFLRLSWLGAKSHRRQTFVANFVAKIQEALLDISLNSVRGL